MAVLKNMSESTIFIRGLERGGTVAAVIQENGPRVRQDVGERWGGVEGRACVIFPCDSHGDEPRHKESLLTPSERRVHAHARTQACRSTAHKDGCLPVAMSAEEVSVLDDWELQRVNALRPHQTATASSTLWRFFVHLFDLFCTRPHQSRTSARLSPLVIHHPTTLSPAPPQRDDGGWWNERW